MPAFLYASFVSWCLSGERLFKTTHHQDTKTQREDREFKSIQDANENPLLKNQLKA
jgi:hypothetical protein